MKRTIYYQYIRYVKEVNQIDFKTFSYLIAQKHNAKVYSCQTGVYWDKEVDKDSFNAEIEQYKAKSVWKRARIHVAAKLKYPKLGG